MITQPGTGLHPALRAFPGAVLELTREGVVQASNGRLEATLERTLVDRPLRAVLAPDSHAALDALLAEPSPDEAPALLSLRLLGRDQEQELAFLASREAASGPQLWLVEVPADPRLELVRGQLSAAASEGAAHRQRLGRETARLARSAEELDRELKESATLSRTVQQQNRQMEQQSEELLSMTRQLHAGQDRLLELSHQVEQRNRELQLALAARSRFYGAMSHELRTPINAVMGYNDLLLASVYGPLNEQQELAVERSQRAAQHLRELVNDVLDLSRLEGGGVELSFQRVQLTPLVHAGLEALRPAAQAAGSELRLRSEGAGEVVTDPRRVLQILDHLVSNALKFGPGTPVFVTLRALSGGGAELEVVDGGPGIAPGDLNRVFEEFVQLGRGENCDGTEIEGTGLGLSLARQLALLLGGRLDASSTPGLGSTFRLTLPSAPPHSAG
jgi:signal transduction histidine kinase